MTKLVIDLSDVAGGTHPDDTVVVWSPVHREGSAGRTVSPTQHTIRLTEGVGEREVEPGPLMVQTHVRAIADTRPKEVVVPDQDTVTLWDLLEQGFTYTQPIISEVTEARAEVREAVARVGTAEQVGQWAEDAQTAETNASTAASDALTIKNSIPGTVAAEIDTQVPPKVAEAIASDRAVADAAAAAAGPAVEAVAGEFGDKANTAFHQMPTLPADSDLNVYTGRTHSGPYTLAGNVDYLNLPPRTGSKPVGTLYNFSSGREDVWQRVTWRYTAEIWERILINGYASPPSWSSWRRVDNLNSKVETVEGKLPALEARSSGSFFRQEIVPDNTDFNKLNTRSHNGLHTLGSTYTYFNAPPPVYSSGRVSGAIFIASTGSGDTWQVAWFRFGGSMWERHEASSGTFNPWRRVDDLGIQQQIKDAIAASSTGAAPLATSLELSGVLTSYEQGEAYIDALAKQMGKVEKRTIATLNNGHKVTAVIIGDSTKPAVVVECALHGDETSGREAAFVWMRMAARQWPSWMDHICVAFIPTANPDRVNVGRLTAGGTDLNRNWDTRTTAQVKGIVSLVNEMDTRLYLSCHEGGDFYEIELSNTNRDYAQESAKAPAQRVYDRVWADLEGAGYRVDAWPSSVSTDGPRTTSTGSLAEVEGIPAVLVEMPSSLAPGGWSGPGAHENLYIKPYDWRLAGYYRILDAVVNEVATMVAGTSINDPLLPDIEKHSLPTIATRLDNQLAAKMDRDREATFFLPTATVKSTGTATDGWLTWEDTPSPMLTVISNGIRFTQPGMYEIAVRTNGSPSFTMYDSPWDSTDRQSVTSLPYTGPLRARMRTGGSFHIPTTSGMAAILVVTRLSD